jgi:hypothetical protein
LRVERLDADKPLRPPAAYRELFKVSDTPDDAPPSLNELVLSRD